MVLTPLALLRQALAQDGLDGWIVPRTDQYQGEYVPECDERLAWVTGFTGSAGTAVVLADQAWLFVDGRYTIQAAQEVAGSGIEVRPLADKPMSDVLAAELPAGTRLGYDPWLHTADQVKKLNAACTKAGAALIETPANPVDRLWLDRPAPPQVPAYAHGVAFAGMEWREKLSLVAAKIQADVLLVADPSVLAWLLNIRGGDVPYTPLALGRALVYADGPVAQVFMDPAKISGELAAQFSPIVSFLPEPELEARLHALSGRKVQVDTAQAPARLVNVLQQAGAELIKGVDPALDLRAAKNPVELNGMRAAHRRDGAAMVQFLAWLDQHPASDELQVAEVLEGFRASRDHFQGLSFPTIAGFAANGAIVHYRSSPASNRTFQPGGLLLLDSGAQYLDGTTDITRTMVIGSPSDEQRRRFTQVLQGHIALARAIFPKGTTGSQLDVLARQSLWADGVDYEHGTGHGVGSFLSVHEGPQRVGKSGNIVALVPGHVLSNEPGYYKQGHFGIRLENLIAVVEAPPVPGGELILYGFEVLTLVPFDLALVESRLLSVTERMWLNTYHDRVCQSIEPLVDAATARWLRNATRPI